MSYVLSEMHILIHLSNFLRMICTSILLFPQSLSLSRCHTYIFAFPPIHQVPHDPRKRASERASDGLRRPILDLVSITTNVRIYVQALKIYTADKKKERERERSKHVVGLKMRYVSLGRRSAGRSVGRSGRVPSLIRLVEDRERGRGHALHFP